MQAERRDQFGPSTILYSTQGKDSCSRQLLHHRGGGGGGYTGFLHLQGGPAETNDLASEGLAVSCLSAYDRRARRVIA